MRVSSRSAKKAVALGRIYFAGVGIVLIVVGVLAIVYYEAPQRWLAGSIALPGIISLIYPFLEARGCRGPNCQGTPRRHQ